jgi:hypothetical protein
MELTRKNLVIAKKHLVSNFIVIVSDKINFALLSATAQGAVMSNHLKPRETKQCH